MKLLDYCAKYNFTSEETKRFLNKDNDVQIRYKKNLLGEIILEDEDIEQLAAMMGEAKEREKRIDEENARLRAEAVKREEEKELKKQRALASMLITSGFSFDGYTITKYSGYISGDDAVQISRGLDGWLSSATNVGEELTKALVKIRRVALQELKEAAYDLGCNAVIGVDYDYITLEPETANSSGGTTYLPYVIAVTANGNAVVIEKNKDEIIVDDDDDEIELTPM